MTLKAQVSTLLNTKMDRQDFLKSIAIGAVAASGAGAALRLLAPKQQKSDATLGYGSSAYGGVKSQSKVS